MAKKNVRALWAAKIAGRLPQKKDSEVLLPGQGKPFRGVVLGIDPSLSGTGLAVLDIKQNFPEHLLYSRTVKTNPKLPMSVRLVEIAHAVTQTLLDFPVDHVAVEEIIYVQNFQIALKLGAVRGAVITAAGLRELPVYEYSPLRIKQAVVGYGRANKEQVIRQISGLLSLKKDLPSDEADAAAVALCHAQTHRE